MISIHDISNSKKSNGAPGDISDMQYFGSRVLDKLSKTVNMVLQYCDNIQDLSFEAHQREHIKQLLRYLDNLYLYLGLP